MNLPELGPNSPLRSKAGKAPAAKALRRLLVPLEKHDQANLYSWCLAQSGRWPELGMIYAIPNAGGFTGGFKKNRGRVMQMLRQGVRKGVPDLCLPVARGGFHALYLEMKREGEEQPTEDQLLWHKALRAQGNCVIVAVGFVAGCAALTDYLKGAYGPPFPEPPNPPRSRAGGPTSIIGE
jgi:hypothetical protein